MISSALPSPATSLNTAAVVLPLAAVTLCWRAASQAENFTSEDAQTIRLMDEEERAQLNDPLARLEHDEDAKAVAQEEAHRMSDLRSSSEARWKDDYEGNKSLRRRLRCVSVCGSWRRGQ